MTIIGMVAIPWTVWMILTILGRVTFLGMVTILGNTGTPQNLQRKISQNERTQYVKMARHSGFLEENVDKTVKYVGKTKK